MASVVEGVPRARGGVAWGGPGVQLQPQIRISRLWSAIGSGCARRRRWQPSRARRAGCRSELVLAQQITPSQPTSAPTSAPAGRLLPVPLCWENGRVFGGGRALVVVSPKLPPVGTRHEQRSCERVCEHTDCSKS